MILTKNSTDLFKGFEIVVYYPRRYRLIDVPIKLCVLVITLIVLLESDTP